MTTYEKLVMIVEVDDGFLTWDERMDLLIELMQEDPVAYLEAARRWQAAR